MSGNLRTYLSWVRREYFKSILVSVVLKKKKKNILIKSSQGKDKFTQAHRLQSIIKRSQGRDLSGILEEKLWRNAVCLLSQAYA